MRQPRRERRDASNKLRVAGALWFFIGVGWGMFIIPAMREVSAGRALFVLGLPAYGDGPFEDVGIETTVSLLLVFLLVSILDCVAGVMLWRRMTIGAILSFVMIPVSAVFWWGFAYPIPPFLAAAAVALTIAGRSSLRRGWKIPASLDQYGGPTQSDPRSPRSLP